MIAMEDRVAITFNDWTQSRAVVSLGTNTGADILPFQMWRRFKEAFAPEFVARAIAESALPVRNCLDPFGGSGTTALSCQFLGVHPVTIEVNPYLADLIESKLTTYDADLLAREFGLIFRHADACSVEDLEGDFGNLPPTFVEPGVGDRWLFSRAVAGRLAALLRGIGQLPDERHRRFFRVLLGGILVDISNVSVNGKGRRYRGGWEGKQRTIADLERAFRAVAARAIADVHRFSPRLCASYELRRGDCKQMLQDLVPCDLAVFSPPYPNSFDYTDIYNVELWILGYLDTHRSCQALRASTLYSHVQITRDNPVVPAGSPRLDATIERLLARRDQLWSRQLPEMVCGYFRDMAGVLDLMRGWIREDGQVWMVVGDSRYADVQIETAAILADLAPQSGWTVRTAEPCRSMRASPQQGGGFALSETLLVLARD